MYYQSAYNGLCPKGSVYVQLVEESVLERHRENDSMANLRLGVFGSEEAYRHAQSYVASLLKHREWKQLPEALTVAQTECKKFVDLRTFGVKGKGCCKDPWLWIQVKRESDNKRRAAEAAGKGDKYNVPLVGMILPYASSMIQESCR